jgi:hypothetical protein
MAAPTTLKVYMWRRHQAATPPTPPVMTGHPTQASLHMVDSDHRDRREELRHQLEKVSLGVLHPMSQRSFLSLPSMQKDAKPQP